MRMRKRKTFEYREYRPRANRLDREHLHIIIQRGKVSKSTLTYNMLAQYASDPVRRCDIATTFYALYFHGNYIASVPGLPRSVRVLIMRMRHYCHKMIHNVLC